MTLGSGGEELPNRRKSMRKIKEVLRLKYGLGLSARQIASSCGIARSTVAEYLMRAQAAGPGGPLPAASEGATIEARFFAAGAAVPGEPPLPPPPDLAPPPHENHN